MEPSEQPRMSELPARSKLVMGCTSCTCHNWASACRTPTFPVWLSAQQKKQKKEEEKEEEEEEEEERKSR